MNLLNIKQIIIFFLLIMFNINVITAQENDSLITEKYNSTIASANKLFDAKSYNEAIVLYKEAQQIKPDEEYPKFKLEDINTILEIRNQINKPAQEKEKKRPFWKKEEEKKPIIEEKKEEPKKEIITPKPVVEEKIIEEKPKEIIIAKPIIEQEARPIIEEPVVIKKVEEPIKIIEELVVEEPVIEPIIEPQKAIEEIEEPKVEVPKAVVKTEKPKTIAKPKKEELSPEELNAKLQKLYTEERTVEIFETPNKTTTKVVINKGGNIVIFSKVVHTWGGVFYFKEIPGYGEESIVKEFFVRETKYTK